MKKSLIAAAMISGLFTAGAMAADKVIEDSFSISNGAEINIDVPVGSIKLVTADTDEITLTIELEEKSNSWFSKTDIDDLELEKKVSNKRVRLTIDEDDVEQHWVITVPESSDLNVNLGVGEAKLKGVMKNTTLDVGVGEASVQAEDSQHFAFVEAESGVGEADIDGVRNVEFDRHMVGGEAEWMGKGKHQIKVKVGVGEADIDL